MDEAEKMEEIGRLLLDESFRFASVEGHRRFIELVEPEPPGFWRKAVEDGDEDVGRAAMRRLLELVEAGVDREDAFEAAKDGLARMIGWVAYEAVRLAGLLGDARLLPALVRGMLAASARSGPTVPSEDDYERVLRTFGPRAVEPVLAQLRDSAYDSPEAWLLRVYLEGETEPESWELVRKSAPGGDAPERDHVIELLAERES